VDGRRAPALRFGDPRAQALAGALCVTLHALTGITNKSLRALMTDLLGGSYTMNRASYDLTRLRQNGLITRVLGRNLYQLTDDGLAFAIIYTKVHNRVLRPLLATTAPHPTTTTHRVAHHRPAHQHPLRRRTTTHSGCRTLCPSAKVSATKDRYVPSETALGRDGP
jgi:hypothetical protein